MTENNVAAQAGDEPIRAALHTVDIHLKCALEHIDAGRLDRAKICIATSCRTVQSVSPRATADVERNAKRQAERVERLVCAAKVYTFNYLQDEHEEPELCTCGPKQHAELVELFAALAAIATTKTGA